MEDLDRDTLIDKAVKLGLDRSLACKKSIGWLRTFVEEQTLSNSKYDLERLIANGHTAHEQLKHWK